MLDPTDTNVLIDVPQQRAVSESSIFVVDDRALFPARTGIVGVGDLQAELRRCEVRVRARIQIDVPRVVRVGTGFLARTPTLAVAFAFPYEEIDDDLGLEDLPGADRVDQLAVKVNVDLTPLSGVHSKVGVGHTLLVGHGYEGCPVGHLDDRVLVHDLEAATDRGLLGRIFVLDPTHPHLIHHGVLEQTDGSELVRLPLGGGLVAGGGRLGRGGGGGVLIHFRTPFPSCKAVLLQLQPQNFIAG